MHFVPSTLLEKPDYDGMCQRSGSQCVWMWQLDNLTAGLEAKEYETKTQGTRRTEAARSVGEGDTSHACGLCLWNGGCVVGPFASVLMQLMRVCHLMMQRLLLPVGYAARLAV